MKMIGASSDNFKKFIEKDYYYVDKTLLIEELITKIDEVVLLPRPRRFGKTLNISMIKYYFDINENSKELFKGLNIEKSSIYNKHINKYPVISLTFKDVKGLNWDEDHTKLKAEIKREYTNHKYLLDSDKLDYLDKDYFKKVYEGNEDIDYSMSILELSRLLCQHHNKEVVILLDEYDTPVNKLLDNDHYKYIMNFLRNIIGSTFKGNKYIFKAVITGILRIAKESIFSGANNIDVYTILDNDFSDKFGFNEYEVLGMLKYYNIEDNINEVREWYNGYTFGNNVIYNPFSIINYVKKNKLKAYWIRSGEDTLIKNLLINSDIAIKEKLQELIKGNSIKEEIEENIVFNQLNNRKYLWSLLLFSGYLKASKNDSNDDSDKYILSVPNKEVMRLYVSIVEDYFNVLTNNSLKIIDYIKEGNIKLFGNELERIVMNIISNYDIKDENSFHMLMISLLYYLEASGEYKVKSNIESGYGRYDICIVPNDKNKLGYIIEIKKSDTSKRVEEWADKALKQIEEEKYYTELGSNNIKNILLIGLAFKGQNIVIKSKKL